MKLTDQVADRVANLAFGSCGIALSATSLGLAGIAGLPALIVAGTIMGFALAAKQRHAVDDKATLGRIRNHLVAEWLSDQSFGWSDRKQIEAACDLLSEHLTQCMLSPKELADAASGPDGRRFPEAATEIVMRALVKQCPTFSTSPAKDFASAVITRAFEAAIEDETYFKKFQPHLLIETARVSGRTLGVVEDIKRDIQDLPAATASAVAGDLRAMEERILLALSSTRAEADPVSAEAFKTAVGTLLKSGNARKVHAVSLAADGDVAGAAALLLELADAQQVALADAKKQTIGTLMELGGLTLFSAPATSLAAYQRAYSLSADDQEILERVGTAMLHAGRFSEAKAVFLRVEDGNADPVLRVQAKYHRAQVSLQENDFNEAWNIFGEALEEAQAANSDFFIAACLHNLGATAIVLEHPSARQLLTDAIAFNVEGGRPHRAITSALNLAQLLMQNDEPGEAATVLLELEPMLDEDAPREHFANIIGKAGLETAMRGDIALAVSAWEASERSYRAVGSKEADKVKQLREGLIQFLESKKPPK